MKVIFSVLGLIFLHVNLHANEIEWLHNYDKAVVKATLEKKKIFLLVTSETCRWCRKLESTTLEDPTIVERINQKYIAVALTRDKDSYPDYLQARMVPMNYFLKDNGRVINRIPGFWNVEDFHSILDDVNYNLKKQE